MSFSTIFKAFNNKEMRKRILFVLLLVLIFRALSHIPVPLDEPTRLRQLLDSLINQQQFIGFLNFLSGGALASFSIVLMGLGPYINASIIMQLLTKAVPKLEAINKEGESGRRRINQYTRFLSLPLAIMQSIGVIFLIRQQAEAVGGIEFTSSAFQWFLMAVVLTGGSMLLMWLGELMSEQGVGNGISLLIFAGIISQLPATISLLVSTVVGVNASFSFFGLFDVPISLDGLVFVSALALAGVLVTYFVVKLNEAQRIITVSYAKRVRGNRAYGGVDTVLPIKLITAGVIPIIFAVAFLSVPAFVGSLLQNASTDWMANLGANLVEWFNIADTGGHGGFITGDLSEYIYPAAYFVLVVMFTYFYTGIMFNSKEIAENLQKQGGFIAGIRPGQQTEAYLRRIVNRLTLFGSVALGTLALLPFILDAIVLAIYNTPISAQLTIGGTGLLISVSVAIETLRQIESRALMVTYDADPDEK